MKIIKSEAIETLKQIILLAGDVRDIVLECENEKAKEILTEGRIELSNAALALRNIRNKLHKKIKEL